MGGWRLMAWKERITDLEVRSEALNPANSYIVQAPAGSGKTGLLIKRFLTLLAFVEAPEEILAITFTRKAAGQMRSRLIDAFQMAASNVVPDNDYEKEIRELATQALERDSVKGWALRENPSRLKVYTIDALSLALSHLMPVLSGLGRLPGITERAEEFYRAAARRTAALVEDEGKDGVAVRDALLHLDNSVTALEDRLVTMLAKRDQWLRHTHHPDGDMKVWDAEAREGLEATIKEIVEAPLHSLLPAIGAERIDRIIRLARFASKNLGEGSAAAMIASLDGKPETRAENLPAWKAFSRFLLTNDGDLRKPGGVRKDIGFPATDKSEESVALRDDFKALLEELSADETLIELLKEIRKLPSARIDEDDWGILLSLLHILPVAERELRRVFAESSEVDFAEVSLSALASLGSEDDPTDLMLAVDMKIKHILVDEYQDTSRTQLSLLEKLTCGWLEGDGRTLFIVGDPMQSIYLFREAEVGLFLEARERGIGNLELKPLTLECNFRSTDKIIDWVNDTFVKAFPDDEDSFLGKMRYAPSVAAADIKGDTRGVNIRLYSERADDSEIAEIVELIKGKPAGESVAVLGRSRSHLIGISEALREAGVDFRTQDLVPLAERPVIGDLLSLLRALSHPMDRIAWLSVLRAPWCGLSLQDILKLSENDIDSSVLQLAKIEARVGSLSEESGARLLKTRAALERALGLRGRVPARALLEGLWIELGGPACLANEDAMTDAEAFFEMIERTAPFFDMPSSKTLVASMENLYAAHAGEDNSLVEIMTMHKAKGLEFDHVVLPGLGRSPGRDDKEMLVWLERDAGSEREEGKGLLLAPMTARSAAKREDGLYEYIDSLKKDKLKNEMTRLLYVAATRAKKGLYIFGHVNVNKDGEPKADKRSLLHVIRESLALDEAGKVVEVAEAGGGATTAKGRDERGLKRLAASWKRPEPKEDSAAGEIPVTDLDDEGRRIYEWAHEEKKYVGEVAHSYFDRIVKEGVKGWGEERIDAELSRIAMKLRELGVSREKSGKAASQCADILKKALADERGRWVFSDHPEGETEYALTHLLDGKKVASVIDRTFVDDGVRWIIDYKTGTHEGGNLAEFLESEKEEYRPQIERYESAMRALGEEREIKRALYFPALSEFVEL